MRSLITEAQKREIETLAAEHSDALIAYGADLYNQGVWKGAIIAIACMSTMQLISFGVQEYKKHKNGHQTEN